MTVLWVQVTLWTVSAKTSASNQNTFRFDEPMRGKTERVEAVWLWKRVVMGRLRDDVSWKAFNLGSFQSWLIVLSGEVGGRISPQPELFLCTDKQRWRQVGGGLGVSWGGGGGLSCKLWFCDLACTFYFHFPRSEWVCLNFSFHFFIIFFKLCWLILSSTWHEWDFSPHFYLESGTQSSQKFFKHPLVPGNALKWELWTYRCCHHSCLSFSVNPSDSDSFFLYTWLVFFSIKKMRLGKKNGLCFSDNFGCLINVTWFCSFNRWIFV